MKVKIQSHVTNGRMSRNRTDLSDALKQFEGQDIAISIEKAKKSRSTQENRYYRGVIVPLIKAGLKEATGETYSNDQVHDLLKTRFLMYKVKIKDGEFSGDDEYLTRIKSTTELSTVEMEQYLEDCRGFALEYLGVTIPLPNENLTIEFEN